MEVVKDYVLARFEEIKEKYSKAEKYILNHNDALDKERNVESHILSKALVEDLLC